MNVKKVLNYYIQVVQKILISFSLFLLYFIGFGITKLVEIISNRKQLKRKRTGMESYWIIPAEAESDFNDCLKQS
jgi:hypothetical protein